MTLLLVVSGRYPLHSVDPQLPARLMTVAPADSATAVLASLLHHRRRAFSPTCFRLAYVKNTVSREMSPGYLDLYLNHV